MVHSAINMDSILEPIIDSASTTIAACDHEGETAGENATAAVPIGDAALCENVKE